MICLWMRVTFHGCSRMRRVSRALLLYLPLASSTWRANCQAECRWRSCSYATWGMREQPEYAYARLSWNQTIWKWWSMMVSPCLSMCPIAILLSGLHYSLVELVWNFLWWPPALVPTQHCAQLFAPLQRMSCVSFTQTSRVNYWSTSCLWFDAKHMPISYHIIGEVCSPGFFTWNCLQTFEWSQLDTVWISGICPLMASRAHSHKRMEPNYWSTSSHVRCKQLTCPPWTELCCLETNNFLMHPRLKWRISVTNRSKQQKHTMSNYKSE